MKSIKLALLAVLLLGVLSACKRHESTAPAADPAPAATEPAATPAPAMPDPAATAPAATDPNATMPATDTPPTDAADDSEDLPHSGGDKVGGAPAPGAPSN